MFTGDAGRRRLVVKGTVLGLALMVILLAGFAWRGSDRLAPPGDGPVLELELGQIGLACGGHLAVIPGYVEVPRNSAVVLVNNHMWRNEVYLSTENKPFRAVNGQPPEHATAWAVLEPGERLEVRAPRQRGQYFVITGNQWHYVAGLRGRLVVK